MTAALITSAQLRLLSPSCPADVMAPALDRACRKYDIATDRRIRHFLAQVAHESVGLTRLVESLNYTTPERIRKVWPKRFPTLNSARPFVRNPQALANKVYGGRLGNKGANDGWIYRGGGLIMNTGRANYALASGHVGLNLVAEPHLLRTPEIAALAAAGFWSANGLNALADEDDDEVLARTMAEHLAVNEEDDLLDVTRGVNGGRIGLDDRRLWLQRAGRIWTDR
ncbi:glycoside hydrolase family 19 protein [Brevundimonas nasdae]|uniref:glycoside hydrolase family 19 protein n=1 Tax=Brevundimonas nasdae TaxID=172043 RepID=UPI003F68D120